MCVVSKFEKNSFDEHFVHIFVNFHEMTSSSTKRTKYHDKSCLVNLSFIEIRMKDVMHVIDNLEKIIEI